METDAEESTASPPPPLSTLAAGRYWIRRADPLYLQRASHTVSRESPPIEVRTGAGRCVPVTLRPSTRSDEEGATDVLTHNRSRFAYPGGGIGGAGFTSDQRYGLYAGYGVLLLDRTLFFLDRGRCQAHAFP